MDGQDEQDNRLPPAKRTRSTIGCAFVEDLSVLRGPSRIPFESFPIPWNPLANSSFAPLTDPLSPLVEIFSPFPTFGGSLLSFLQPLRGPSSSFVALRGILFFVPSRIVPQVSQSTGPCRGCAAARRRDRPPSAGRQVIVNSRRGSIETKVAGRIGFAPATARQELARISHQDAEHKVEKCWLLTSWGALIGVFRGQTVLGAPWLVFSPSARTCSLEWCSGYALRSRARPEAENPAPSCTLEKSATPW